MMRGQAVHAGCWWGVCLAVWIAGRDAAVADQIRLRDGTELSGVIVEKDPQSVLIRLPRSQVMMVNGLPIPDPLRAGTIAPAFDAVDLTGTRLSVPSPQARATLIKFWATWCPHCRADVQLMKALFARYRDKGLSLITISVDRDHAALAQFVQREHLPYPVVMAYGERDPAQALLPELYEIRGIPAYYLIDGRGVITQTWSGSLIETHATIEEALVSVLGLPQTRP